MEPLIIAKHLTKRFGEVAAVKGVDFTVYKGECFGFLGPNGAGKTSTIRMIYGFSPMTAGVLKVMGMDIRTSARLIKKHIGVVSQENNLDTDLTLMENLLVYSRYFNIPKKEALTRARQLIEFMQLGDKIHHLVEHLSGGMKRRLVLARALINSPSLLLLDEPTTGLDPQARHLIWQRLRSLKKTGVSIILTTHYMEEAAQLCDRIAVMDHGKIIAAGPPKEMILTHVGAEINELRIAPELDEEIRTSLHDLELKTDRFDDTFYIYIPAGKPLFKELTHRLIQYTHTEMVHRPATLEDLFLQLTGRELSES